MKYARIQDPTNISRREIDELIDEGNQVIVQFSKPQYTVDLLSELNELAKKHGSSLQVRFYSHPIDGFDAANLDSLSDVVSLSLDCLHR